MSARLRAYLLLLGTVVIWGLAVPIIKFTLQEIDPLPFLTYRFFIAAAVAVLTFNPKTLKYLKSPKTFSLIIFHALLAAPVALGALFLGLNNSTVLDTSLITIIAPLIVSILGFFILKERITKKEKTGTAIAVLGTCLIIFAPIYFGGDMGFGKLTGNFFLLVYLLADSFAIILLKKLLRLNVPALFITNFSFVIGFLIFAPIAFLQNPNLILDITSLTLAYHGGVWYMALMSGTLAYTMRSIAQKSIEVSEASLFSYLLPLISTPVAVLWLDEQITPYFVVGAIIIAVGVFIAEIRTRSLAS